MAVLGFGKKNQEVDRYTGKPFLKLVDSFVLKSIGHLDASQDQLLTQMTPKLQTIFGSGSWEEMVISQLAFPPDVREKIKDLWEKNQAIAKQNNAVLSPMQFAEMFVANNVTDS